MTARRGKTAAGPKEPVAQDGVAELLDRVERSGIVALSPKAISPSRYYNRHTVDVIPEADRDFAELVDSIRVNGGNAIPALVNKGESGYELVYGHRRLAACKLLGINLKVHVETGLSPTQMAQLQLLENRDRKSPSVIDQALQIASQFKEGAWGSQTDLAKTMNISEGRVSLLVQVAKYVPRDLPMYHPNHHKITYRQADALARLGKEQKKDLKARMDWIRVNKSTLSAEEATNHLIHGAVSGDRTGKPVVVWTGSGSSATLKVRGLTTAKAVELNAGIEALLKQLGLEAVASKGRKPRKR